MRVQTAKQLMQLQDWSSQIAARNESGLSVRQWCEVNGVNIKTYYLRQKRVREEMLEKITTPLVPPAIPKQISVRNPNPQKQPEIVALSTLQIHAPQETAQETPAHSTRRGQKASPIIVHIGNSAVEIGNDAEGALIERVLKAVSRI